MITIVERVRCPRCQTRMDLASSAPRKDGSEKRIFECGKCHYVETVMVADPLTSSNLERLTNNVRPPV
ncbi:MAG: hypothetical protein JWR80_8679 [Bradyrhizobium sp.]|nr:hypothetical protein [Bradyrhizobium sp.]